MVLLDYKSRLPIYEQLYHGIIRLAALGAMGAGDPLPSVRALAQELGVNPNTVQKAYQLLERDGLIVSAPGKGSFLADQGGKLNEKRLKAKETLKQAVTDALASGMSGEEIRSSVETILSGGDPHD